MLKKLAVGAAAFFVLPLTAVGAGIRRAVDNFSNGKPFRGVAMAATTAFAAVAGNHYIANPRENLADSLHFAIHGVQERGTGGFIAHAVTDLTVANVKWATTAFYVASKLVGTTAGIASDIGSGVDQTIEDSRSRPLPNPKINPIIKLARQPKL